MLVQEEEVWAERETKMREQAKHVTINRIAGHRLVVWTVITRIKVMITQWVESPVQILEQSVLLAKGITDPCSMERYKQLEVTVNL